MLPWVRIYWPSRVWDVWPWLKPTEIKWRPKFIYCSDAMLLHNKRVEICWKMRLKVGSGILDPCTNLLPIRCRFVVIGFRFHVCQTTCWCDRAKFMGQLALSCACMAQVLASANWARGCGKCQITTPLDWVEWPPDCLRTGMRMANMPLSTPSHGRDAHSSGVCRSAV